MNAVTKTLPLATISLADRFDLTKTPVLLTGAQAIVRLLLIQKERDRRAGKNTGAFVSGYRGSPLGGLDQQFHRVASLFKANDVHFEPGLNEELAATAIWGAQQAEIRGEGRFDGVFGLWYGKGPGVDRTGDAFRHSNLAGTSPWGGVLALMGDDHTAESSTTAHQSEYAFVDAMMPILSPAGVQELLDYGVMGWDLSRFASVWVGLKCLKDTAESTAVVDGDPARMRPVAPADFPLPPGGLSIRTPDGVLVQEARLHEHKWPAVLAWLKANRINRIITPGGAQARLGIVTHGKSYLDVRQALDVLGLDEKACEALGLRILKLGCTWPLVPEEMKSFAAGLDRILVVEEKRGLVEGQLRETLYEAEHRPICEGKRDEAGAWLFPAKGALDPLDIAIALGERLAKVSSDARIASGLAQARAIKSKSGAVKVEAERTPYFCSGCPHSRSTHIPEGARAYAGIGCHFMAQFMDRRTDGYTQMGGEGANWVGESRFSTRRHVFQNLGDGTYNHSGALALRWAIDAKVDVTYKILFNDAVAMTGGQRHEGGLTVPQVAAQVAADGAQRVVVVTDDTEKYAPGTVWPQGLTIRPREELIAVEEELAEVPGVTVLIYDQTCAAEKRRRRKRGTFPDPDKRAFINARVCEGCGDCGTKSNCVSIQPRETEFGRKRVIDQSSCNKDFSCVDGFCPSFVTISGVAPRKSGGATLAPAPVTPEPLRCDIQDRPFGVLVAGVGGTGVVTVGAILGMAAHLEGKAAAMIDMAGLAQKGGAVLSHLKIARNPEDIHAIRVGPGEADLLLGCDLVVAGSKTALAGLVPGRGKAVVNAAEIFPGDFTRKPDFSLPAERLKRSIAAAAGDAVHFIDAASAARAAVGDAIGANMFVLGYAYQSGLVPLSSAAIRRAIELNGEAVAMNLAAFDWGRAAAADPAAVPGVAPPTPAPEPTLAEFIERRAGELVRYQNAAYAARYRATVTKVTAAESTRVGGDALSKAVARNLYKLMAYKDEYEVARLYTDGEFARDLAERFSGAPGLTFYMAPPLFARKDPKTGEAKKIAFGPWMMRALGMLAQFKSLRGTWADPFGRSEDRKIERRLLADYEALCDRFAAELSVENAAVALALAELPEKVRGYGHVKTAAVGRVEAERDNLLASWPRGQAAMRRAAE